MSNIHSTNIKVFPATRRSGEYDPFSRLMSESTITSIINRLVDCDGFVINDVSDVYRLNGTDVETASGTENVNDLEFNIFGYYIKISGKTSESNSEPGMAELLDGFKNDTDIYAHITLDANKIPNTDGPTYVQLVGRDEDDFYTGVIFTNSESYTPDPDTLIVHSLHILTKENREVNGTLGTWWTIPKASVIKFYNIDGGEIF